MGRLVGIGVALVVIAVAGLFLGFGAYFVEDTEGGGPVEVAPVSVESNTVAIDPACLWPLLDASVSPDAPEVPTRIPLKDCSPGDATTEIDGDWIRVSLQRGGPEDVDVERRFSGVRPVHTEGEGRLVLEAYDNWGGSGVFSSLIVGRLTSQGTALSDISVHAFGDRCNGGLSGARVGPDGRVLANANMTPWDILMIPLSGLAFDDQWAAAKERYGDFLGLAPACAICCSAVTHEYELGFGGALVSRGYRYASSAGSSSADPLTLCLEQSVRSAGGEDELAGPKERASLEKLIDACVR